MKEFIEILVLSPKRRLKYPETIVKRAEQLRPGQRVQIEGRDEVFVILRVDHERHLADLLRKGRVRKVETGIPLRLLRAVQEPGEVNELEVSA